MLAVLSATGAIVSATDDAGRARVAALFHPRDTEFAARFATQAEIADLTAELTRLRSETRMLALEKEAMALKVATLESEVGPITGSIPDAAEAGAGEPAAEAMPEPQPKAGEDVEPAAGKPADTPKAVRTIDVGFVPLPVERKHPTKAAEPEDAAAAPEAQPSDLDEDTEDLAALAHPTARVLPSSVEQTRFAIQIGMADSMKAVRALWKKLSSDNDLLIGRLEPAVAIAEENDRIRIRLLAGPFADAADAIQLCTLLVERGVDCRAVRSEGQKLVMR